MKTLAVTLSLTLALAGAGLSSCDKKAEAATVDKAKIATSVKNDVHSMVESFNGRDLASVVRHDGPDYISMVHGQANVIGVAADHESTKAMLSDPLVWVTLGNESVDVADSGEMAVYRTTYKLRLTDPKTKRDGYEYGNWVIGYKKQADGYWKIAWNVISDTPAPKAG